MTTWNLWEDPLISTNVLQFSLWLWVYYKEQTDDQVSVEFGRDLTTNGREDS